MHLRGPAPIPGTPEASAEHIGNHEETRLNHSQAHGTTLIEGHPDGFPVDGDALVQGRKQDNRAKDILIADEDLLGAARDWLGMTEDRFPDDGDDSRRHVAHLVSKLFPGGAARFVVHASYSRETAAAA